MDSKTELLNCVADHCTGSACKQLQDASIDLKEEAQHKNKFKIFNKPIAVDKPQLPQIINGYFIIGEIGAGSYGTVFHVTKNGQQFALKKVRNDASSLKEFTKLMFISSPSVVKCYECFRDDN